jgi:7-cyano-7-deazaguanine synthase
MAQQDGKLAVVLLSGGLDSATALAVARRDGFICHALTFDYGQRHRFELGAAGKVAASLGAAGHRVVRLDLSAEGGFGRSALTDEIAVPKDRPEIEPFAAPVQGQSAMLFCEAALRCDPALRSPLRRAKKRARVRNPQSAIPITYVPARNTIFLSVALGLAEVLGAFDIFIGVNAVDYSGYPDCRPEFLEAFQRLANVATAAAVEARGSFRIHAPLLRMTKAEIVRTGLSLGVDFSLTHSCYDPAGDGAACGHCDACRLRLAGFQAAGATDPARYRDRP